MNVVAFREIAVVLFLVFIYFFWSAKSLSDKSSGDSEMGAVFFRVGMAVVAFVALVILGFAYLVWQL